MAKKVKMVIHAEPGVGKSTFAAKAPHPFFLTTDGNFEWLDLPEKDHIQLFSWEESKQVFAKIIAKDPAFDEYDTIVVDLIEDMFKWCEMEYCKRNKLNHVSDLPFGRAYDETRNEFYIEIGKLLGADKHVILLTHGVTKVEKDRRGVEITKYIPSPRIPDKVWDMIEGRVRYFLRAFVKGEEEDGKMIKRRYLSIIPKENEFGIARGIDEANTPEDIPLEWSVFAAVIGLDEVQLPKKEPVKAPRAKKVEAPKESTPIEVVVAEPVATTSSEEPITEPAKEEIPVVIPEVVVESIPATPTPAPTQPAKTMTQAEKLAAIKAKIAAMKKEGEVK